MVHVPCCCQHFFRSRRLTTSQTLGAIVLILSCVGCWQEVRYEPDETAQTAPQASPAVPETPVIEDQLGVSANNEAIVEPEIEQEDVEQAPAVESEMTLTAQPEAKSPDSARTLLAAWRMCSDWSMAAALQAKGRNRENYGVRLERAEAEALLLEVELPHLPTHIAGTDRLSKNLTFLLEEAGPILARDLSDQHGAPHAALAELATKTHVLLLSYTPSSTRLEPVIAEIRRAAENSGLPESVWREFVDLLAAKAEFKQVKAAIYLLHQRATESLEMSNDQ